MAHVGRGGKKKPLRISVSWRQSWDVNVYLKNDYGFFGAHGCVSKQTLKKM